MTIAATVGGAEVLVSEIDASEERLRATRLASALPQPGTSEGRQLRRWLTQVLVTARVVAAEAAAVGLTADGAPTEAELLPDAAARLELGSVAAAILDDAVARALFLYVTADVAIGANEIAEYHRRNPFRFSGPARWGDRRVAPPLEDVRTAIADHLLGAARRRAFRTWLDVRRAELVQLAPGYEHPGDPRQPDNTHKH